MKTKAKKTKLITIITVLLILVAAEICILIRVQDRAGKGTALDVPPAVQHKKTTCITYKDVPSIADKEIKDGKLRLYYDDRFIFDSAVTGVKTLSVRSSITGTEQPDESVLEIDPDDPNKIVASGCGTARVTLEDGKKIEVRVGKAPISLVLIAGQSNGEGRIAENRSIETVREQYVLNEEGTAYSTYGFSDREISEEVTWYSDVTEDLSIGNYEIFLPESLTDNDYNSRFAKTNCLTDAAGAAGKGGIDSAFAYRWHQLTNEKIWLVNACHHGSSITTWQSDGEEQDNDFWQAVELYKGAEDLLDEEVRAGHYILKHKGVLWYQGEADREMSADDYYDHLEALHRDLKEEIGTEFMGIFMVRSTIRNDEPYIDFLMTGPRTALYYAASDDKQADMFLASHIEELWTDNEAVKDYFIRQYGNEDAFNDAYPTISKEMKMPEVTKDVLGIVHYTQIAYNEMGFDGAESVCSYLGYFKSEDEPEIVKVVLEDGVEDVSGTGIRIPEDESVPLAIKVYPAGLEKEAVTETSDNINLSPSGIQIRGDKQGYIKISVRQYSVRINVTQE